MRLAQGYSARASDTGFPHTVRDPYCRCAPNMLLHPKENPTMALELGSSVLYHMVQWRKQGPCVFSVRGAAKATAKRDWNSGLP